MTQQYIWSRKPATEWAEGYPIGNGRLGGMIMGMPLAERISLNHDRLWRRYWTGRTYSIHKIFPQIQRLCLEEKWEEVNELLKAHVPMQGRTVYVNPFVPLGDIGLYPFHFGDTEVINYNRHLDMDKGIVSVSYEAGGLKYSREYLSSLAEPVMAINMKCSRAARISGELTLFRVPDRECEITTEASLNELVLKGTFEEGVRFAAVVRIINNGGRLTKGISEYIEPQGFEIEKNRPDFLHGAKDAPHWFRFMKEQYPIERCGISTAFDAADSVLTLVSMATDHESEGDLAALCRKRIENASHNFDELKSDHIQTYQKFYRRCSLSLAGSAESKSLPTDELLDKARQTKKVSTELYEQAFNLGRYLAISSGMPAAKGQAFKAPINLQGLWNQDFRPAWDSDYHLDLNVEMCYWPLPMVNLADLMRPLADWAYGLLPQAQKFAREVYGKNGAIYSGVNDAEFSGSVCDLGMLATGSTTWLSQILWLAWEYTNDQLLLGSRIYPVMREIGQFFEEFLIEDNKKRLIAAPSGSPEICPAGRSFESMLSVTSTHDLELIRQLFENLIEASSVLGCDLHKQTEWKRILEKLPMPTINKEGRLLEWLDKDYEVTDPSHRHRSHFVGFCPGDRITAEDTPDYNEGIRKALAKRHSYGVGTSCSIDKAWDGQIFARLYEGERTLDLIDSEIICHSIDNLLMSICVWSDKVEGLRWFGGRKVYQLEAGIGLVGALTELFIQDRRGLVRLLPALPAKMATGHIKGVLCRGGFEVDLSWRDGRIEEALIKSLRGSKCRLKCYTGQKYEVRDCYGQIVMGCRDIVEFETRKGNVYIVRPLK